MASLRIAVVGAPGAGKSALLAALAATVQRPLVATEAASIHALGERMYDLVLECVDVRDVIGDVRGASPLGPSGRGGSYTGPFVCVYTKMDFTDGTMFNGDEDANMDPEEEATVLLRNECRLEIAFNLRTGDAACVDASFTVSARTGWELDELVRYVEHLQPLAH